MTLDHLVIPGGKEAIEEDERHVKDAGTNLKTLPVAKVGALKILIKIITAVD